MESMISRFFFHNWQQKLVAFGSALLIWFFVSHSIIETKVIPGIPIRIVNLPRDKTIIGLHPNGMLSKRITLTLTGSKDAIRDVESGDIEILIDASMIDHDDWIMQIHKNNLVSLNPSIDLKNHVTNVSSTDYIIKIRPLITDKVPMTILAPTGEPPEGYEFLDIWPRRLLQTLSGAEEEIQNLKAKGLEVTFNLNDITKADLDATKSSSNYLQDDEISFVVPSKWKKISIPFHNNALEDFNDPEAQYLKIDFLRKELLPIKNFLPIRIFYPLKFSDTLNPKTFTLDPAFPVQEKNNLTYFSKHLFARGVSKLFLDIVRENMEISIVAAPPTERELLEWTIDIIGTDSLEDIYVAFLMTHLNNSKNIQENILKNRELLLRNRFRDYSQKLMLYSTPQKKLHLESRLENNQIRVFNE